MQENGPLSVAGSQGVAFTQNETPFVPGDYLEFVCTGKPGGNAWLVSGNSSLVDGFENLGPMI
jgi:hypothetical protein